MSIMTSSSRAPPSSPPTAYLPSPSVSSSSQEMSIASTAVTIPTGPALGRHTSSRKWLSPAEQARQQRIREAKSQRYASLSTSSSQGVESKSDVQPVRNEALQKWHLLKARLDKAYPNSSGILPSTFEEWVEHEDWIKNNRQQRLTTKQTDLLKRPDSNITKDYGSNQASPPRMVPFGGKVFKGVEGPVLSLPTIWSRNAPQQSRYVAMWPQHKECVYEGEDRQATKTSDFHRFLPLARDWRPQAHLGEQGTAGPNYKFWEEYPRHEIFDFDRLEAESSRNHLQIYPFGIGCPTPNCLICHDYRAYYGLQNDDRYWEAILNYTEDMSPLNMSHCLNSDLLAALDSDDL